MPLVSGISDSLHYRVKSIEEGRSDVEAAIAAGTAKVH